MAHGPRDLPKLELFAAEIATSLGGTVAILGEGSWPSAAIAFGAQHVVLLRDHGASLTLSLPLERSWPVNTRGSWWAVIAEFKTAVERFRRAHPNAVSIADVVVGIAPVLERITHTRWEVSFPGTPVPSEAWLKDGARSVGLFQENDAVRVVVWISGQMETRSPSTPEAIALLGPWLDEKVRRQDAESEAAAVARAKEDERLRAIPRPSVAAITQRIAAGKRFRTGGGRYYEIFSWDAAKKAVQIEIFDEGYTEVRDATPEDIARAIDHHPAVFADPA